ncbi:MAG: site-2 protease family protein [Candidatus Aenigmatarchaeota archaeon]
MTFEYIITIAIISIIALFLYIDRKNIEVKGIILLRRTKRFNKLLETIAEKYKKLFNYLGYFSIVSAFIAVGIFFYFAVAELLKPPKNMAPIQLVLPSLPGLCSSGFVLCVPPYFWFLVIPLIAIFHEAMHAIYAKISNLRIKSVGYAFILILPAFFVEIDEKKLKKAKTLDKLKIFSSGSFGNFILALIGLALLYIFSFVFDMMYVESGLIFYVINNTPAYYANLSGILIGINDKEIRNIADLENIKKELQPNQTIKVITTSGVYNITLTENKTIGIIIKEVYYKGKNDFFERNKETILSGFSLIREFFFWLIILNFGIGMFNLLPIKPLDGGLFFEEVFRRLKYGEKIYKTFSLLTILLIALLFLKAILRF